MLDRSGAAILPRFFGIIIRINVEAGESHHRPHFHARFNLVFFAGCRTLASEVPPTGR